MKLVEKGIPEEEKRIELYGFISYIPTFRAIHPPS